MEKEYKIIRPQTFEIVGKTRDWLDFKGDAYINGKRIYHRLFIKPIIKDEERDT